MNDFVLELKDYNIYGSVLCPDNGIKGVVVIVHGMCEHKERYYHFMEFLSSNGYGSVVYDLRGHGKNIDSCDLGYIGNRNALLLDLDLVVDYVSDNFSKVPVILFGHSMGSLVVRNYIQNNDIKINKVILSGPPTYNPFIKCSDILISFYKVLKGDRYRSKFLNMISIGGYNKGYDIPNQWLTTDSSVVLKYNNDELCGFIFTVNGFDCLFYLLKSAYIKKNYRCNNLDLPIFLIGGSDDPVIGGVDKFNHLYNFLVELGYGNVEKTLIDGCRHEILNEKGKDKVYRKILKFIDE